MKACLVGAIVLICGLFWMLSQISIETWLIAATASDARPSVKPFALFYLRNIGSLRAYNRSENLPPLQFILGGCGDRISQDIPCQQTFEWLLKEGEDINATDNTKLGFTPLHSAVVKCNLGTVEYILSKGVNVNTPATGEKFHGQTSLKVLGQLKHCLAAQEIDALIKSKGGHE